ncbi:MAG TPA: murein biosynthesis integral membrane protein MurJ [Candidatus Acidoferrum sp.]|nr:murein biosynthesis integral membrane protein MurJ [Candidatus Acidoferrum sp.]
MSDGRTLARAGLIVTSAFLASRLLGGVRSVVIGAQFGAGRDLDSFLAAFRIPDVIFQLVAAGALSSALIPIVAGLRANAEQERAWRVASTVTTIMMAMLLVLAAVVALAAPVLVPAITSGFPAAQSAQTAELTRVMLISPIFLALGSVATSLLNANGRFGASAVAPLAYNLAIIGAAVLLAPTMGIEGLAIGVVAGSICHFLVQVAPLRAVGFRFRPGVDLADPDARQALVLMAPRAIGLGASQLTFLVATSLLSGQPAGSLTAFTFAFTLFQIPFGVIGVPIGIVALPSLSTELARGDVERYLSLLTRSMRLILFVMIPIAALTIVLRTQVVSAVFDWGRFGVTGVDATAIALVVLIVALPSESLTAMLARGFYADRDTTIPVVAAVIAVAINTSVAIVTVGTLGVAGVSLGIVLGSWAEAVLLAATLRRRRPTFDLGSIAAAALPIVIAAAIGAAVAFAALVGLDQLLGGVTGKAGTVIELVLATAAGGFAYLVTSRMLGIAEVGTLFGLLQSAVRRGATV